MKRATLTLMVATLVMSLCMSPVEARTKRSHRAKVQFRQQHPCPATGAHKGPCKGYVIDHIKPLACGGADRAENLQWQTVAEGKAKDKLERRGCSR